MPKVRYTVDLEEEMWKKLHMVAVGCDMPLSMLMRLVIRWMISKPGWDPQKDLVIK